MKYLRKRKHMVFLGSILKIFILVGLVFIILLPLYKLFIDTININPDNDIYYFVPVKINFNNYRRIGRVFFNERLLYNSLILAFVCSLFQVCICGLAGYGFTKLKFRGSKLIFWMLMIPLFIPIQAMQVQLDALFNEYPLLGISFFHNKYSIFILYLLGFGIKTPLFIYLFKLTYRNVNDELLDQARIDGCSHISVFFRIALPMSMSAVIPTFVLTFIWQYNDSYLPTYFGTFYDNFEVIATRLSLGRMVGGANDAAFFMLLPILIIYIIISKIFFGSLIQNNFSSY